MSGRDEAKERRADAPVVVERLVHIDDQIVRLTLFANTYEPLLKLLLEKETDRKALRRALIEKGLLTVLGVGLTALLVLLWEGMQARLGLK